MAFNSFTPGLDRQEEMQKAPLGQFNSLRRPSPVATQYKRQSEMYGQALRNLSRAARRGDAEAGIKAIGLRDQANAAGFTPGGIGRSENFQSNVADREQSMLRNNEVVENENALDRRNTGVDRGSVNQNATLGAGRGTPLSRRSDFAEQDRMARERSTLSGAFGSRAQADASAQNTRTSAQNTRTSAALDILEGASRTSDPYEGNMDQFTQGRQAAESLGVKDPSSILKGNRDLKYRQTLDSALGQAKTPEEVSALRERGARNGISPEAFDRRKKWWDT